VRARRVPGSRGLLALLVPLSQRVPVAGGRFLWERVLDPAEEEERAGGRGLLKRGQGLMGNTRAGVLERVSVLVCPPLSVAAAVFLWVIPDIAVCK